MVSIIVLTFNNLKYSKQCIESLYQHTPISDFELILVDNASNDGTPAWITDLSKNNKNVKYILNKENCNFAGGCNQGAKIVSGEYLLFLNNDTILTAGWLSLMVECFGRDSKIGIVGNKHLFPNSDIVWHCGGVIGSDFTPKHIYIGHTNKSPMVNKSREYSFVTGACLLIKKNIFENVGGFSESYKNSFEDVDLCFKVKELGYKIFYCCKSCIYHYGSISTGRNDNNLTNYAILFKKWFGRGMLVANESLYWQQDNYPHCLTLENKADMYIWTLRHDFENSLSWKLTAPFRFVGKMIMAAYQILFYFFTH